MPGMLEALAELKNPQVQGQTIIRVLSSLQNQQIVSQLLAALEKAFGTDLASLLQHQFKGSNILHIICEANFCRDQNQVQIQSEAVALLEKAGVLQQVISQQNLLGQIPFMIHCQGSFNFNQKLLPKNSAAVEDRKSVV